MAICLPLFIVLAVFLVILFVSLSYSSRRHEAFLNIIHMMGGKMLAGNMLIKGTYLQNQAEVIYQEQKYIFSHYAGRKNSPPYFLIEYDHFSPRLLRIRKEGPADGFLKKVGLSQETQLQDPEFNSKVFLEGEDEVFIQNFFSRVEARQAVLRILNNFDIIQFKDGICSLKKSPEHTLNNFNDSLDALNKQVLTQALEDLAVLVKCMPAQGSQEGLQRQKVGVINKKLAIGIIVGISLSAFAMSVLAKPFDLINDVQILQPTLIAGVIFTLVVGFVLMQKLRGYANSSKNLILGAIFLSVGLVFTAFIALTLLNGVLDSSDPVSYECVVVDKYVQGKKDGKSYRVVVRGIEDNYFYYKFSVSPQEYASITPSTTKYLITARSGAFNWPWVSSRKRMQDEY